MRIAVILITPETNEKTFTPTHSYVSTQRLKRTDLSVGLASKTGVCLSTVPGIPMKVLLGMAS